MHDPEKGEEGDINSYGNVFTVEDKPPSWLQKKLQWINHNRIEATILTAMTIIAVTGVSYYYRYKKIENKTANERVAEFKLSKGDLIVKGEHYDGLIKEAVKDQRYDEDKADTLYYLMVAPERVNKLLYKENAPDVVNPVSEEVAKKLYFKSVNGLMETNETLGYYMKESYHGMTDPANRGENIWNVYKEKASYEISGDRQQTRYVGPTARLNLNLREKNDFFVREISQDDYNDYVGKIIPYKPQ